MKPSKKTAKKTRKRTSAAHRLRSVRRVLGGLSTVRVGQMYGDSQRAVSNWVQRFKKHGAKGLQKSPHPGRPSTINPSQMKKLRVFVAKTHSNSQVISGRALAEFIKKSFGITITRQQGRRILNRLDS